MCENHSTLNITAQSLNYTKCTYNSPINSPIYSRYQTNCMNRPPGPFLICSRIVYKRHVYNRIITCNARAQL